MGMHKGFPAVRAGGAGLVLRHASPLRERPGAQRGGLRRTLARSGLILLMALAALLLASEAMGLTWFPFARPPPAAREKRHAPGRKPLQERPAEALLRPETEPGAVATAASPPTATVPQQISSPGAQVPGGADGAQPQETAPTLAGAALPLRVPEPMDPGTRASTSLSVERAAAAEGSVAAGAGSESAASWRKSTEGATSPAFRYEKVKMAWSPQSVHYRGAPWRRGVGTWMQHCQERAEPAQFEEAFFSKPCPGDCNGNGVCESLSGICRCRKGFNGTDCAGLVDHACNLPPEPRWPNGPKVNTMCAAQCNHRLAQCFCGEGTPFPHRPVIAPCGYPALENGEVNFTAPDPELLFSKDPERIGWCMLDPQEVSAGRHKLPVKGFCPMNYDGIGGPFGEARIPAFCFNQCTGPAFGTCDGSYCKCEPGWSGTDCSTPSASVMSSRSAPLPPWLPSSGVKVPKDTILDSAGRLLLPRKQKRPLIYVYDLPRKFTSWLFEGRVSKFHCTTRVFIGDQASNNNDNWLYGAEMMIYESMLVSSHRTNNPEEADYFFVPFLTSCLMHQADDSPTYAMRTETPENRVRPNWLIDWVLELLRALRSEYPYWDRHEGRDHIWMFMWDEGSCHVPQAIRNSIILSHWGNTESDHKGCQTAWCGDVCKLVPSWKLGEFPCYDAEKDIVVPPRKTPSFLNAKLRSRTYEERPNLFFHRGNMGAAFMFGRPEHGYSMGVRQKVAYYFSSTPDKNGSFGVRSEDGVKVEHGGHQNYAEELASSKFCGVFPGDGFSARPSDAMLQGCIPVIIQDGIEKPFENFLDYEAFAVRIREEDIPDMIKILKSIPVHRVRQMLGTIQRILSRWFFRLPLEMQARREEAIMGRKPNWKEAVEQIPGDDAFDTIIQILHYKLYNDPWRQTVKNTPSENSGLAEGCVRP